MILRRISENDADEVFYFRSDPEVNRYSTRPLATDPKQALEFIQLLNDLLAGNKGIHWIMTLKEKPSKMIGNIGIWRLIPEHYRGEIGYVLQTDMHRKGYMSEAITAVIQYGFTVLGLHSLEAKVSPDNIPSIKLLERNKFIREAYFKEDHFANGRFYDTAVYSLLKSTWLIDER